jgi:hypothetical protein
MMEYSGGVMPAVGTIVSHEALDRMRQKNPVPSFAEDLGRRNTPIYTSGANGDQSEGTCDSSPMPLDGCELQQQASSNDGFLQSELYAAGAGDPLTMVPPSLPHPLLPFNTGQMGSMPISSAGLIAALNDGAFWKHLYQYKPTIINNRDDIGDLSKLLPALEEKEASGGKLLLSLPSAVESLRCPEIFWMFPSMPFFYLDSSSADSCSRAVAQSRLRRCSYPWQRCDRDSSSTRRIWCGWQQKCRGPP